jgi:hypothetical protein
LARRKPRLTHQNHTGVRARFAGGARGSRDPHGTLPIVAAMTLIMDEHCGKWPVNSWLGNPSNTPINQVQHREES